MRRMAVLAVLTVLVSLTAGAAPAQACSIAAPGPTAEERLHDADRAIYGRVLSVEPETARFEEQRAMVRVRRVYRGWVDPVVRLEYPTSDSVCGTTLRAGTDVGLLLHGRGPTFAIFSLSHISLRALDRAADGLWHAPDRPCAFGRGVGATRSAAVALACLGSGPGTTALR